jgi:predicted RNA-binding Zn-ribbon protein involved in translation (DUF1610 family)
MKCPHCKTEMSELPASTHWCPRCGTIYRLGVTATPSDVYRFQPRHTTVSLDGNGNTQRTN